MQHCCPWPRCSTHSACVPPVPCRPPVQLQSTGEWDSLVSRAFASMDPNGDGLLSAGELEALLCGEDGCEVRPGSRAAQAAAVQRCAHCRRQGARPPRPRPLSRPTKLH